MSKPRPIHSLHRDLRSAPDAAEPSFSYEQESFMGGGDDSRRLEDVEDEFHRRLQASSSSSSRRDSAAAGGGGGAGGGGSSSSFWRSTTSSSQQQASLQHSGGTGGCGSNSSCLQPRFGSPGGGGGGTMLPSSTSSSSSAGKKNRQPQSDSAANKPPKQQSLLGYALALDEEINSRNTNSNEASATTVTPKRKKNPVGGSSKTNHNAAMQPNNNSQSYRPCNSFGSAGSNHSSGKNDARAKKELSKQRTAERLRKLGAQSAEVDIGHIVESVSIPTPTPTPVDTTTTTSHHMQQQTTSTASAAAAATPQHQQHLSDKSGYILPPVNFADMQNHHGFGSNSALDRSSSDQSTGSLFYGKTPNSGAVLGKSSSLIFPTGVETNGDPDDQLTNNSRDDPQSDAKRRKINLLLDQCESVRFPFKKKLMLNNLNLTANDIPLSDLCGTSLGNSLFKLSLAGNRLGTVPSQLVQNLPTLKNLDLSQCELHQLPDTWNLPKLTRLNLSHNRLTDFPEEGMLEGLPELLDLNLYGNKVAEIIIPAGRDLLSKLETINLGYNDLAYLPDDLDQLSALKSLKVMNNFLEKVPMRVCDMELKSIDVSSNPVIQPPIETCERGISSMKRYYCQLRMEEQSKQKSLEASQRKSGGGSVGGPQPTTAKLKKKAYGAASLLKSLRRTSDDSNQSIGSSQQQQQASSGPLKSVLPASAPVRSISLPPPPASHLMKLQQRQRSKDSKEAPTESAEGVEKGQQGEVVLPSSQDAALAKVEESVPDEAAMADEESAVAVEEQPSASALSSAQPPEEAVVGVTAQLPPPPEPVVTTVNDTLKVIFVGMAMVGKTSMIKRLIEGKDAVIPTHDERTVGVDIYEWDPKNDKRFEDIDSRIQITDKELSQEVGDVDVKFSVWDFAGQHVYHATHELFFSPRALYVLVWDMGATNRDTIRRQKANGMNRDAETGAFKLTYDSSDDEEEEDDDEPDLPEEDEARRADRALERDIDEKVQFWVDCIQSSAPGAAILPVASFADYFDESDGGDAEAKRRCNMLKQRLVKHEERRLNGIKERLRELTEQKRANDLAAVRLRKLLCAYTRPKLIFGDDADNSVVRVSGTQYTGFHKLTSKIISIATGFEKGKWRYPIFQGHVGARIPRMRLEVRDAVRTMRDRFKVAEWGYFINQLRDRGLMSVEDISDALFFLTNVGELSYFGGIEASGNKELLNPVENSIPEVCTTRQYDEAGSKGTDEDEEEDEFDDEDHAILSMDDTSITAPSTSSDGSITTVDDFMSTGLSQFVFLNPRWLVAAVACILRHDLDREIMETRRQASIAPGPLHLNHQGSFYEAHLNCPVITAEDACLLWQAKRITKKAAERAQEYSNNLTMTPFEFLQQLLIRFGVFVPIDLSIEKAFLGGKEYAHLVSVTEGEGIGFSAPPSADSENDNAKFFFLPSLLGPCEPSDAWTYKSTDSWKTTLCHSVLFPDGVPPGLMERLTASVLSSIYDVAHRKENTTITDFYGQRLATYEGQLTVKEVLCWRTAFFIKLGAKAQSSTDGSFKESIVEIFTHIADRESHLCVGSDYMGVGMRRLIVSGRGQVGDGGRKIWKGGYLLVLKCINRVMDNYGGLEYERHGFCPECLSKKSVSEAASWEFTKVRSAVMNTEGNLRCQHGHLVDTRLIAGPSDNLQTDKGAGKPTVPLPDPTVPVKDLLRAVVVVGLWDGKAQKVVRVGSGFIVDRKRGLIVTAAHTLMNIWGDKNYPFGENYYGLRQGKVVIGVIPDDKEAVDSGIVANGKDMAAFRYFAKIVAKDSSLDQGGCCRLDACVLKITTRMEKDVGGDGEGCGDQPEKLLLNDPRALKHEQLQSLKMTEKCELDEQVRILGYNQGGEGLLAPGERLNRYVDFARGYVCKFHHGQDATATTPAGAASGGGGGVTATAGAGAAQQQQGKQQRGDLFQPRSEYVVICPTISGHSGGPVVNQQGEVIGILSRADPAENQRCYIAPTHEWKPLVKHAKFAL